MTSMQLQQKSQRPSWRLALVSAGFILLQSICTAVIAISGIRVAIGLAALAAASGLHRPATAFHSDRIRIPMMLSSTEAAGTNESTISSFAISGSGALTPVTQSVPSYGSTNCWNAITPNGKYAYTSNAGSSSISGFVIGSGGTLQPIGSTVVATQPEGSINLDIAISQDGNYLYALNSMVGTIGVSKINADGSLNPEGDIDGLPKNVGFNGIAAY